MNLDDLKQLPGSPHVIVFGAGPSAPRFYDLVERQHTVVAPSTMILPLQAAGIDVDYTCCMDPGAVMPLHFRNADTSGALIYLPSIVRRCYADWQGPKYMAWDLPGSSVLHLAVDVALRLGASEITLVGADFNFGLSRQSHASGVVRHEAHDGNQRTRRRGVDRIVAGRVRGAARADDRQAS